MTPIETDNRVFVANAAGHDYSSAKKYGRIVSLTVGNLNPVNVDRIAFLIAERLADSRSGDYLLLSGHQAINAIAALLFLTKHGRVNLLVYDAKAKSYAHRRITTEHLEGILNEQYPSTNTGATSTESSGGV